MPQKDVFGKALLDYFNGNYTEDIITWTNISEKDILPLPYLFRSFSEMLPLEQFALRECKGKILDVGCGSGSHSLWLQEQGFNVKAIDHSKGAITVAKYRGVLNTALRSLLEETDSYDTVLLLMNGTGIFKKLDQLIVYLEHLKSLLNPQGQILIDSSDIAYMYTDVDDVFWRNSDDRYYGELDYYLSYKNEEEKPMTWLYLDFNTLRTACETLGLNCKKITDGAHHEYLAQISL